MGHGQFYIAAVKARPTHIAFEITTQGAKIISGPDKLEQVASNARTAAEEFSRELPEDFRKIEHAGNTVELEEIKSWHYIQFERMLKMKEEKWQTNQT